MTRKVKHFSHFEQLEPRILLSGDSLLNIAPEPQEDTILDNTPLVVKYMELPDTNEQAEGQNNLEPIQSDTPNTDVCRPIITLLADDDSTINESIDADLRVENISSALTGDDIIVLSNDTYGKIESKVDTTQDGIMPICENDADLSKEYATCIEIRGPPASETIDSEISISHLHYEESEVRPGILDEYAASVQPGGIVELPGLYLVDATVDCFNGQVIYLDFYGETDVTYNGPIVVEGIEIPIFSAASAGLAGQEQEIINQVIAELEHIYVGTGIIFTTSQPTQGSEYSTIYIGGDDSAFSEYGSFLGLAETVDVGNRNHADDGFVFSDELFLISPDISQLTGTIAHEVGHMLGYSHLSSHPLSGELSEFAATITQSISLSAPNQPIWAGGIGFDKSVTVWDWDAGPWTVLGYGITDFGTSLSARAYASTGTVSVNFGGSLSISYPDSVLPGQQNVPLTISAGFSSGTMDGVLGAGIDIPLTFDMSYELPWPLPDGDLDFTIYLEDVLDLMGVPVPPDISLNTSANISPQFGTTNTASGSVTILDVNFDLIHLATFIPAVNAIAAPIDSFLNANLGVELQLLRDDNFRPTSLRGNIDLNGSEAGSFNLMGGSSTIYVDIPLSATNSISLDIEDLLLTNTFDTIFGLGFNPYFQAEIDTSIVSAELYKYDFPGFSIPLLSLPQRTLSFTLTDPPAITIPVFEPEISVQGNSYNISDGDTTPSTTDGTDFGSVILGQPGPTRIFTVTNTGNATLSLGSVSYPSGYSLIEGLESILPAGASDSFTVRLDSSTGGTKSGQISFTNNDSNESPFNFSITGTVIPPGEIRVTGNGYNIPDGDTTPSTTDGTDFGYVIQGQPGPTRTFTVTNTGGLPLSLGPVRLPRDFSLIDELVSNLPAGDSDSFTVRLNSSIEGPKGGQISFRNNNSMEDFNFSITGTVITIPADIRVTGKGYIIFDGDTTPSTTDGTDFGSVILGQTGPTSTFTVANVTKIGGPPLLLGPVSLPNGFSLVDDLVRMLLPGETNDFTVRLDSNTVGTKSGQIIFVNSDSNESPFNFWITGTVNPTNNIPIVQIDSILPAPVDEGDTASLLASFSDPDSGDTHTAMINWGDGTVEPGTVNESAGEVSGSHVYTDDNIYTVTVTVTDNNGASGSDSLAVIVNDLGPTAVLTGDTVLDEGQAGSFDASDSTSFPDAIVLYEWDWEYDGVTFIPSGDTDAIQSHTWFDDGFYTVAVRVTDDDGSTDIATLAVTVNDLGLVAVLSGDTVRDEGQTGFFDASGSTSWPDVIATYEWDWDYDGITFIPSGDTGTIHLHTWFDNRPYTVAVRVIDDDGSADIATLAVTVNDLGPAAVLSGDTVRDEGQTGFFDASGSTSFPDAIVLYEWDWEYDGVTFIPSGDTGTIQSHTWFDDGFYTVAVRVIDDDGSADIATLAVTVNDLGPAAVLSGDTVRDEGQTGSFDAGGSTSFPDAIVLYEWDWDHDGVTFIPSGDTGTIQSQTWFDDGFYTVAVRVIDDDGSIDIATLAVIVNNVAPTVNAGHDRIANEGDSVIFSGSFGDPGSGDTHTYDWDFGDSSPTTSGTLTSSHVYADNGIYTVKLTVTDDDGGIGVDTLEVTVLNVAPVVDSGADQTANEGDVVHFSGSFTDLGLADTHTIEWDFGDSSPTASGTLTPSHVYVDNGIYTVKLTVTDDDGGIGVDTLAVTVLNIAPSLADAMFKVEENSPNWTMVGVIIGSDPGNDTLTYTIVGGSGETAFAIDATTGLITVADETQLDYETTSSFILEVQVADDDGATDTATVTIDLLNQASITGIIFVDVNENGVYDANEPGVDGITIELLDNNGDPILGDQSNPVTAITSNGGFYLFNGLDPDTYLLHEVQPTGVDDGEEILGSLGGTIPANDTMRLTLERIDATDYDFAELGQSVTSGDTATIGFWQNKHGQALIKQGGTALADWLTKNFGNIFGDRFVGGDGNDVATFYRDQLFRQKREKSTGPAMVDAQFMAVALVTYFTSSNLAGNVASDYGFNVTETGIGTKIVNVGSNGAAFDVASSSNLTIMQLLLATNALTDKPNNLSGFARIYDRNGDGEIDVEEASLRRLANEVYSAINEQGDI